MATTLISTQEIISIFLSHMSSALKISPKFLICCFPLAIFFWKSYRFLKTHYSIYNTQIIFISNVLFEIFLKHLYQWNSHSPNHIDFWLCLYPFNSSYMYFLSFLTKTILVQTCFYKLLQTYITFHLVYCTNWISASGSSFQQFILHKEPTKSVPHSSAAFLHLRPLPLNWHFPSTLKLKLLHFSKKPHKTTSPPDTALSPSHSHSYFLRSVYIC